MDPSVLVLATLILISVLGGFGYALGRRRSAGYLADGQQMASTPDYYGWYTLTCMFLPAAVISAVAALLALAGLVAVPGIIVAAGWVALPALLLLPALKRIRPELNARVPVERTVYAILLSAALVSILTTLGVFLSVLFESIRFFQEDAVSIVEFFTGTTWAPGEAFKESMDLSGREAADPKFGALPLFLGTFLITAIAMVVAVPIGLASAIYLAEYAPKKLRRIAKPLIEVLAGIPTVVYGFFAAITVAPFLVDLGELIGMDVSFKNGLAPGMIMGVMIIPFMSSLCDDVITAVPQNLRRGAMALGSTKSEATKKVILPAALPGIIAAFLLAVSRAIGETMIVLMAAGQLPNMTLDPTEEVTTVTVHIVSNLTGDLSYDNPQTLSAFSLGLTLLILTLILNIVSLIVVRKFRMRYEGD